MGRRLLRIARDGTVTEVLTGFKQLADLGYRPDTGQLGLPEMSSSRVFLLTLDRRESCAPQPSTIRRPADR